MTAEFYKQNRGIEMNSKSNVKKVIGVVSGKGGVGKSSVTSMLAVATQRMGYKTAILDADITGPSIPKAFGLERKAMGNDSEILPVVTDTGIKVISINSLLEDSTDPVVWRGPILSGVVEPIGAIVTLVLTSLVTPVLPFILAFAAGAMIYVVVEELIPESQTGEHSNIGPIGTALGFALMMVLDVALG